MAAELIRSGKLVAFGTETVYGLGGDATDDAAVARIFAAKGRPAFNPLICHLPDIDSAFALGDGNDLAVSLAGNFWPGPMTLVLGKADGCPVGDLATSGLASIALRVPAAETARLFLQEAAVPVAAPSANRSGRISPTLAEHVEDELGGIDDLALILDTGPAETGLESTVIDARGQVPVILRPGGITQEMIRGATGVDPIDGGSNRKEGSHAKPLSPGRMASHYAPSTPLRVDRKEADGDEVWIGFGPDPAPASMASFNLSVSGDIVEAAANLYAVMRQADAVGASAISVASIPRKGLGIAINDRLTRAATAPSE